MSKPILVFGAGESTDYIIKNYKALLNNFFILCVDTALAPLLKEGILPKGVFVEEAQSIISKAFICNKENVQLFAGLSSLPTLTSYFKKENISYFTTKYTEASFIESMEKDNLLPPTNPPFGSVGLTSVFYALKFRKDESIPVLVTGLDFSYSIGKTHCRGSMAHIGRLISHNRLLTIDNLNAAFSGSSIKTYDKEQNIFITTPSLSNYCALFNNIFSSEKNLFDVSNSGLPLSIPRIKLSNIKTINNEEVMISKTSFDSLFINKLNSYLSKEREDLLILRSLLTEDKGLNEDELKEKITNIAKNREYLYLHYPDGYSFNYNQSFLNRIRTELDYFLKIL